MHARLALRSLQLWMVVWRQLWKLYFAFSKEGFSTESLCEMSTAFISLIYLAILLGPLQYIVPLNLVFALFSIFFFFCCEKNPLIIKRPSYYGNLCSKFKKRKMPHSMNFDLKMFVDKSYNLLFSFQPTILQYTNVQLSANCKPLLLHLSMFLWSQHL